MIHKHHEWLADVNKSIVESYEREQEIARESGRTQETGHTVESRWDDVLTEWLPPQYEIGKRKYLLLETEDGPEITKETDLSVLGTPVKVGGTWFLMVLFLVVALALCRLAVVGVKVEPPAAQRGRTTLTPARSTGC
jgi:hypothetical protein